MTELREDNKPAQSLRERKKAKTRATIQRHALRLFREQGYDATTVEQIAEAAEVSPSTFFRYFPTKEDVVLYDPFDPMLIAAFEAQPPEVSPIHAMRVATRSTFENMSPAEREDQWERTVLVLSVPDLRMRMLDEVVTSGQLLAELVARRVGRDPDDVAVRTLVGAVIGAMISPLLAGSLDARADLPALVDESLACLEAGLPL